jgi:hypothetical protein
MVLSVTLSDGNNVKYLIKLPQADKLQTAKETPALKEKVSSWEIERLGTALTTGSIPVGRTTAILRPLDPSLNPQLCEFLNQRVRSMTVTDPSEQREGSLRSGTTTHYAK